MPQHSRFIFAAKSGIFCLLYEEYRSKKVLELSEQIITTPPLFLDYPELTRELNLLSKSGLQVEKSLSSDFLPPTPQMGGLRSKNEEQTNSEIRSS
jgi:hypothetical protein